MVRFIHAADLHLDSPFSGLNHLPDPLWKAIRGSTFLSLHKIISLAIEKKVDFILFSGDIYDLDDRSVKAQAQFKRELNRLKEKNIIAYIIHGNHDFLSNTSLHLTLPENVKVFGKEVETFIQATNTNEEVALTGFSYDKRWVHERVIDDYPKRKSTVDYHIGLLHGYKEGETSDHARYAPFSINELREKKYDYWALGHIHQRAKVSNHPLAYYAGNIQGRNKNETGEKGCLFIEMTQDSTHSEFLPTASIEWEQIQVDVSDEQTLNGIFEKIQSSLPNEQNRSKFFAITVFVSEDLSYSLKNKIEQQDFIDALQIVKDDFFHWIIELRVKEKNRSMQIPVLKKMFPEAWERAVSKMSAEEVFEETTKEFFHQVKFASLLEDRSENYRDRMVQLALELVEGTEGENAHED